MTRTEHLDDAAFAARIRGTCAAVEQATLVAAPPLVDLLDAPASVTQLPFARRAPKFTAVALSLAAVLAVGALWLGRGPRQVDTLAGFTATLVHAAHGSPLPEGFALSELGTNSLVYRSGSRSFTLRTAIDDSLIEGTLTVRAGRPAELSIGRGAARIAWTERPGLIVTIDATGEWTHTEMVALVESTMMLSTRAWTAATSNGGFTPLERDRDDDRFTYRSMAALTEGSSHSSRSLAGSLQTGVSMLIEHTYGRIVGSPTARSMGFWGSNRWRVMAIPGDVRVDIVRTADGIVVETLAPVCDSGMPTSCFTVATGEGDESGVRPGYRAKYYDANGVLTATEVAE